MAISLANRHKVRRMYMSAKEKKITTIDDLLETGKKTGKLTSSEINGFLKARFRR